MPQALRIRDHHTNRHRHHAYDTQRRVRQLSLPDPPSQLQAQYQPTALECAHAEQGVP